MRTNTDIPDMLKAFDFNVIQTSHITAKMLSAIQGLFESNYDKANFQYLAKSFETLRFLALAHDNDKPIGFALGDAVESPIPQMAGLQCILLAGICCVSPEYRRKGLFSFLEMLAIRQSGIVEKAQQVLVCGRMAHPASLRIISRNPTIVPKYGISPSSWQKEVGLRVAELYGVDIDPETFVVRGKGTPIGYPKMDIQVEEEEWRLFENVNRNRGDSLLAIAWSPDAPDGW